MTDCQNRAQTPLGIPTVFRIRAYFALLLVCWHFAPANGQHVIDAPSAAEAVVSVGITVRDLDRSVAFYRDVLSFEPIAEDEVHGEDLERLTGVFAARARTVRLRLGEETLDLTEFLAPRGRPLPEDSRANDLWFQHVAIVVRDMDEAYRHLRAHDVEHASPGPQRLPDWNAAAAGIEAFYFRDPDGHFLEVLRFPPGKGDDRWQAADRLFLGIDHTAIVVSDTETSLRFYRDCLGFSVAGESENYGPEQERLNVVFGARLRITTLRAGVGPGIELLEYLAPRGGRPRPVEAAANDLLHWQTQVRVGDVAGVLAEAAAYGGSVVSSGVSSDGSAQGPRSGALVRDPDGHVLHLVDR